MPSTKAESHEKLHTEGRAETVDAAVLANVIALGPICRDALCIAARVQTSTACGAVARLKARGLIEVAPDKVWNHRTQRNVQAYRAVGGSAPTPIGA